MDHAVAAHEGEARAARRDGRKAEKRERRVNLLIGVGNSHVDLGDPNARGGDGAGGARVVRGARAAPTHRAAVAGDVDCAAARAAAAPNRCLTRCLRSPPRTARGAAAAAGSGAGPRAAAGSAASARAAAGTAAARTGGRRRSCFRFRIRCRSWSRRSTCLRCCSMRRFPHLRRSRGWSLASHTRRR